MLRLMLIGLLLCITVIGCQRMVTVSSGTKVVCSECGKTINADIQTLQVSAQEAPKYSVHETMELCPACQAKIAEQKRQEEARQRAEAAKQEKQRLAESRGRLAGIWQGNWKGWNSFLNLQEDGNGFLELSGFAGSISHTIKWKASNSYLTIEIVSGPWKGDKPFESGFSGEYKLQSNHLSVNQRGIGWILYTKQ